MVLTVSAAEGVRPACPPQCVEAAQQDVDGRQGVAIPEDGQEGTRVRVAFVAAQTFSFLTDAGRIILELVLLARAVHC